MEEKNWKISLYCGHQTATAHHLYLLSKEKIKKNTFLDQFSVWIADDSNRNWIYSEGKGGGAAQGQRSTELVIIWFCSGKFTKQEGLHNHNFIMWGL